MNKHVNVFWAVLFLSVFFSLESQAGKVDTVLTYSQSMVKQIKAVVITPDSYNSSKEYPVVYLLHGYSGNYADWVKSVANLSSLTDINQLIIVCPDGNNSWYWDSPVDPAYKYETYVSTELVKWVDEHYKTIRNKTGRAITGLSMGGHGALYLAFRHQDVFGAAGSMSGGVDIRPFPTKWDMAKLLGSYAEHPDNWERNTVMNQLYLLTPNSLSLMIECGTEDFFYNVNEELHRQLLLRNIPHDYVVRPGAHVWSYWGNAIQYQLLFMKNYFNKQNNR